MPWLEATKMELRVEMIKKWKSGSYTVSELANHFGLSRPTVYACIRRYESEGLTGMTDRRPIPGSCPHKTSEDVVERLLEEKRLHEKWGPEKIVTMLRNLEPETTWPAPSTAGRILDDAGLVKRRKKRRPAQINRIAGPIHADVSGHTMTADHKGDFLLGNGVRCYPLTLADPVSRFIYAIVAGDSTSYERAQPAFLRAFREFGLPEFIGSDNGGPFCSNRAVGGLSRLSVWWIRLGITPIRIRKGCPWQNGRHERMHKTLKEETARPPEYDLDGQQLSVDHFRTEFNHLRPHKSLGGKTPASMLVPFARAYPETIPPVEYPGHYEVRRVRTSGEIKWQGALRFLSETLVGELVGLVEIDDGVWSIYFSNLELCRYNERTKSIT